MIDMFIDWLPYLVLHFSSKASASKLLCTYPTFEKTQASASKLLCSYLVWKNVSYCYLTLHFYNTTTTIGKTCKYFLEKLELALPSELCSYPTFYNTTLKKLKLALPSYCAL